MSRINFLSKIAAFRGCEIIHTYILYRCLPNTEGWNNDLN